jgi:nucleolar protein 14
VSVSRLPTDFLSVFVASPLIFSFPQSFYFNGEKKNMGTKRRNKSKRSLSSLPKGLVHRKGKTADPGNPFEISGRQKRVKPKHLVHNRPVSKPKTTKHALESLQRRQTQLRSSIKSTKKANVFVDRRIGQYDPTMSRDDQMLARLVRERTRQSQRTSKFRLEGDNENGESFILTHKGSRLDPNKSEAIYSDDEDDYGNLEAVDTELHFGGSGLASKQADPYGGSSNADLSQIYGQRKTELDDMIARRKVQKAERMQVKEAQIDTVEQMDEDFADLSQLLSFRKDQKIKNPTKPTKEDQEMKQWNIEMKEMMMKPKHKATDRTKSPEEIAKEEADRLHELESRRMARMNGDFEEDDFSDISVSDYEKKNRKSKKNKNKDNSRLQRNPDELSDSDDDLDDKSVEARFTADGNQYLDKKSRSVQHKKDDLDSDSAEESLQSSGETGDGVHPLPEGARVQGNYHAVEQFDSQEAWYDGTIKRVHKQSDGTAKYDIDYDDGDFEENMISENVRPVGKTQEEKTQIRGKTEEELELQFKRNKAKRKAR